MLYALLVLEGQGVQPRASGVRKQVWVYSADAGVCYALKAAGEISKDIAYQSNQKDASLHWGEIFFFFSVQAYKLSAYARK